MKYTIRPLQHGHCDVSTLVPHVDIERNVHMTVKRHGVQLLKASNYNKILYAKNDGAVVGAVVWRRRDNHKMVMVVRNGTFVPFDVSVPQSKRTPVEFLESVFGSGTILCKYLGRDGGTCTGGPQFVTGSIAGNRWLI